MPRSKKLKAVVVSPVKCSHCGRETDSEEIELIIEVTYLKPDRIVSFIVNGIPVFDADWDNNLLKVLKKGGLI